MVDGGTGAGCAGVGAGSGYACVDVVKVGLRNGWWWTLWWAVALVGCIGSLSCPAEAAVELLTGSGGIVGVWGLCGVATMADG